jgi:predicted RNase H-like HicB family nuclease
LPKILIFCGIIIEEKYVISGGEKMRTKLKMIYWKGNKFWVGKLLDHPEIMTQGETLEELEENMKDAYMLMTMEDVPEKHKVKELTLAV